MNRCVRCFGDLPDLAVFCPHCIQAHEPDFNRLLNQVIGDRYRIYRRLGQGGLSTVFAATDLQTDDNVVVKVSDPSQLVRRELSYAIDSNEARQYWTEMLARMEREAETIATIDHPNIVRFYGTGLINQDLRYVVMEFLRGRNLRQEIDGRGSLGLERSLEIILEVAAALGEIHARGIIHRDINPTNIFLSDGRVKLIDFGIAKFPQPPGAPPFTHHSVLSGTVAYASPEQCQSQPLDQRTDLYSLAIVLYEMLTGVRPFTGRTPTEIALKQIQAAPVSPRAIKPDLPAAIDRAILRALAKDPAERQQGIEDFAVELRAGSNRIVIPRQDELTGLPESGVSPEERLKLIRRRRRRFTMAAAGLVVVISAAGLLLGKRLLGSSGAPAQSAENVQVVASPSSTPPVQSPVTAPGSDADSLELAARMSASGNSPGGPSSPAPVAAQPMVTRPINATRSPAPAAAEKPRSTRTSTQPATIPTAPKQSQPKNPPVPTPTIAASRVPPPLSQPDLTQAPRKIEPDQNENRQNSQPAREEVAADSSRRRPHPEIENRRTETQPASDQNQDNDDATKNEKESFGPKLIQWSGRVNREREIRIEMPGVPGTIEIPRVYRDRVGIVEPPSASNDWRLAILRIYGRGNVSILVRWWPLGVSVSKLGSE